MHRHSKRKALLAGVLSLGLALTSAGCARVTLGGHGKVALSGGLSSEVEHSLNDYFAALDKAIETGEAGTTAGSDDPIGQAIAKAAVAGQALQTSGSGPVVRTKRELATLPSWASVGGDQITFTVESMTQRVMTHGPDWVERVPHIVTYNTATHTLVSVVDKDETYDWGRS